MEQYTASNGSKVALDSGGGIRINNQDGLCDGFVWHDNIDTLREFFRAEEDERLGRWRWAENPDYVVYPRADHVVVVNEKSGNRVQATRYSAPINTGLSSAARAYFEAHPEPKPWHDAKPWETWLVTIDGDEHARTLDEDRDLRDPRYSENAWVHITNSRITAGRRIWPEENA